MKSNRELPEGRLATTAASGKRVYLYPADVSGKFQKLKKYSHPILILIFLGIPWIKIGGYQSVLIDLPHRRFSIFGLTFWAHDTPILFLVVASFLLLIASLTALFGRAWCGWACPETVFTEGVYRKIERWIEGNSLDRKRLDESPWSPQKAFIKGKKWTAFVIVSLIFSHSFLAYFVGAERLVDLVQKPPTENLQLFGFMSFFTGLLLFAFGWFREQFCIIACPYGRLQSVLLDSHSWTVAYDSRRGEPRKGSVGQNATTGDCVNCYRCVQVCPTGIDIRRGLQLECIGCTACIDACDEVMGRLKKPKGLIRYATGAGLIGKKTQNFRPRTAILTSLLVVTLGVLTTILSFREPLTTSLLRAKDTPYQVLKNANGEDMILNHFVLVLNNYHFEEVKLLQMTPPQPEILLTTSQKEYVVAPGQARRIDVFLRFPPDQLKQGRGQVQLKLKLRHESEAIEQVVKAKILGPF